MLDAAWSRWDLAGVAMRSGTPPFDDERERSVLATALLAPRCVPVLCALLVPEHFYGEQRRIVWSAILDLHVHGEPVDTATVIGALQLSGELGKVGGHSVVLDLADGLPEPDYAVQGAQRLIQLAHARELMDAGLEVYRSGMRDIDDLDLWSDQQHAKLCAVMQSRVSALVPASLPIISGNVLERALAMRDSGQLPPVLSTGYPAVDRMSGGGMRPGEVWIIGGRPGTSKSALALNICLHSSAPSLVLSLEMPKEQWAERALACMSAVPLTAVRNAKFSEQQFLQLASAQGKLEMLSISVLDKLDVSVGQLATLARTRLKPDAGLGLVVIDYLQLLHGTNKRERREQEVAAISRSLKALAMDLQVTVLALSQLNRLSENRPDKRPQLDDLRESGAVEQDADVVILLHRDESKKDTEQGGETELIFAKQRNGETGKVRLEFIGDFVRFDESGRS
jgi:replicative DNA helicase